METFACSLCSHSISHSPKLPQVFLYIIIIIIMIMIMIIRIKRQSRRIKKAKPPIINQQCVVYKFQCDLCDEGYIGYTRGHLHNRVKGHKQQSSAIARHYKNAHGTIPRDLLKRFEVLKKCKNKFDCLVFEMLFIRTL